MHGGIRDGPTATPRLTQVLLHAGADEVRRSLGCFHQCPAPTPQHASATPTSGIRSAT
jgi:hypothetical protein